jgi:hypothetical protein
MTKKLVMVECLSQHLVKYVVEVEDDISHALDDILINEGDPDYAEFSQEYLGQIPISHREISQEEYFQIFNRDNEYLKEWSTEQKLKFINRINYDEV